LETLETLERCGVKTAGAGRDGEAASAPAVLDVAGKRRVLVVALGAPSSGIPHDWAAGPGRPGVNLTDLSFASASAVGERLAPIRRPGDIVVASVHFGPNWGYDLAEAERGFAHALIDAAGVAVVHGHSSHHPKAIEVYRGKLILYGCGDFLNDYEGIRGYESFRGDLALMYYADVDAAEGSLMALDMTPLRISRFRLTHAAADDIAWLARVLYREAGRFGGGVAQVADGLTLSWPGVRLAAVSP
jgi:poly-gamma-glutamate synthesis protein (capsule biosynthesis protein)